MITRDRIMPILLEACPSFRPTWETELDDEDKKLIYICLGTLAHHLAKLHREQHREEFPAVAKAIESLCVEGDHFTQEAAVIGLLEGIQNVWGNQDLDPEEFQRFLLPAGAKGWADLNRFWSNLGEYYRTHPRGPRGGTPNSEGR